MAKTGRVNVFSTTALRTCRAQTRVSRARAMRRGPGKIQVELNSRMEVIGRLYLPMSQKSAQ
eukprot:2434408-Pyramimonas_sp.AAC.1